MARRPRRLRPQIPATPPPSPPQEVQPELRKPTMPAFVDQFLRLLRMPTMPAWLSAFVQQFLRMPTMPASVQQFLRLLRMPTMPAWLSAFVQSYWRDPVVEQGMPAAAGKKQGKPKREGQKAYAEMYRHRRKSPEELAREQEPASPHYLPGPTIDDHLKKEAEVSDPYEEKTLHVVYLSLRRTSKSKWDFCAVCYFEDNRNIRLEKEALDDHFKENHGRGGTWERCRVCTAMFFTQHLKRHTEYCHPGIAVNENIGI